MNRYFDFEYTVIENETMFSYVWIIDRLFKVFENKPVFNWSITSEYKIVNDRKLRLATTKFRGFEWNVWFDENIPLPYGPWKFNGLPGLILEAKEVNGRYRYVVHRIDYEFESNYSIPTEYEQISLRDFVELNDDFYDLEKTSTRDFKVRVVGGSKKLSRNRELIYEWEDENKE